MSEDKKDEIKLIDINNDNFFNDSDSYFEKNKKNNNDNFLMKLVIISILLSFILIALVVFAPVEKINNTKLAKKITTEKEIPTASKGHFDLFKKRENILLLGVDSNGPDSDPFEKTRTDTMMLISLDNSSKSVNVISIPRDSKVYIEGHGIDKINAAHVAGGIPLTLDTVQEMFGIKVDHYVMVNYDAVKEIVKILGTIPVTVDKKLKYTDYSGKLFINLEPGIQELNAEQVEQFARFRHDVYGDIGRIERQRMLVKGIIAKIQSPESIAKLPEIISTTSNYIKTDMTIFDLTRYAGIAKNININDVVVATLPGQPSENSYISYWILDPDKVQSVIDKLVYRIEKEDPAAEPLKVSLLFNANAEESKEPIAITLSDHGMEIVCEKETTKTTPEVIMHTDNVSFKKYKYLKNIIPELKSAHMTVNYDGYPCGSADITLVIAK